MPKKQLSDPGTIVPASGPGGAVVVGGLVVVSGAHSARFLMVSLLPSL